MWVHTGRLSESVEAKVVWIKWCLLLGVHTLFHDCVFPLSDCKLIRKAYHISLSSAHHVDHIDRKFLSGWTMSIIKNME